MIVSEIIDIKFELKSNRKYGVTSDGRIFNQQTGRELKRTLIGTTIGFCINGKFQSLKKLRTQLVRPENYGCPF